MSSSEAQNCQGKFEFIDKETYGEYIQAPSKLRSFDKGESIVPKHVGI